MTEPDPPERVHRWRMEPSSPFPVVPAGHDSQCPECGEPIEPGDMITLEPRWHGETWLHEECVGEPRGVED